MSVRDVGPLGSCSTTNARHVLAVVSWLAEQDLAPGSRRLCPGLKMASSRQFTAAMMVTHVAHLHHVQLVGLGC